MKIFRNILIGCASILCLGWLIWSILPPIITFTKVDTRTASRQENDAVLLVMAYPEAICRTTEAAYSDLLPYVGIGQKNLIRAGHACLAIVRKGSPVVEYFDNGRYIAPEGFCRVRGANTDPELKVDVKARWRGRRLANVKEILQWFYDHPEKTHGGGTLYAGIVDKANYEATMACINEIQDKDIIEYGPFADGATNCARFVTDAIYNGSLDPELKQNIEDLYKFTPSGLSNIEASNSRDYYYMVNEKGVQKSRKNLDMIQLEALFDGGEGYTDYSTSGTLCPPDNIQADSSWQWLGGLGYGAWFSVKPTADPSEFMVDCHNSKGELNWSATYRSAEPIELPSDFKITYPANFEKMTLVVNDKKLTLNKIA